MKLESTVADRIFEAMAGAPSRRIEELVDLLPEFTWNQVFFEVNRLRRSGQLRVMLDGRGVFTVRGPVQDPGLIIR